MIAPRPHTLALACGLAVASLAVPDAAADPAKERKLRLAGIAATAALYIAGETIGKDAISPDRCRWCSSNALDGPVRDAVHWDDTERARDLSNIVGYGVGPVGGALLLLAASADAPAGSRWSQYGDDIIAMLEIAWYTQIPTVLMKITAGRERPFVNELAPADRPDSQENNLSFWSGHSALTFSLGVGAGMLAQRRGYRLAPAVWAVGLSTAAATAYLRMAADRHYLTDVVTGGVVGALGGIFIPHLTGSLPARTTLAPQPGGLALTGTF